MIHVAPIAQWEGTRLPAAAVYLLPAGLEFIHGSDLGRVLVDVLVDNSRSVEEASCDVGCVGKSRMIRV
jgi:hypothetical protein